MLQQNIVTCPAVKLRVTPPPPVWGATDAIYTPNPALAEVHLDPLAIPTGTPPSNAGNLWFAVRANGARTTDMKNVVFSASGSFIMGGTGMPLVTMLRVEAPSFDTNGIGSANQTDWKAIPAVVAQHIGGGQTDGCVFSFDGSAAFDARPDNPANNVYFVIKIRCEVTPTSLAGILTLRANMHEIVPFQPLKS